MAEAVLWNLRSKNLQFPLTCCGTCFLEGELCNCSASDSIAQQCCVCLPAANRNPRSLRCSVASPQDPSFTPSIENIAAAPEFRHELKHGGFASFTVSNLVQTIVNSC